MSRADRYSGFREFADAHGAALSRAAYLLTGDHQAAEDLLQEALARTAVHWRRVEAGGNPAAYVRKAMLNQLRSWRRRRTHGELLGGTPDRPARDDVAHEVAQRELLTAALASLPPRQRAVLFLRYYEDLSEVETARRLGCAVGTVKRHSHDALVTLRRLSPGLSSQSTTAEAAQ
ncbi:SigE family RNA polymerase sigma factor [Micromonospora noduli]|uniref:SigE family RNA polymerase sigma factor n=1 Tax=Micromonospora noduli TaxID=709876 RepID=UPI0034396D09